jgi:quercetin dioxygenase-like cupin family protein/ketosteroid isomerase-like protein
LLICLTSCAEQTPEAQVPSSAATWDEAAAQEARAAVEKMTPAFESGDVTALSALVAEDGFLGAYDLDMQGKPITLHSRDEAVRFAEQMFAETRKMEAKVSLRMTSLHCQAMSALAVCRGEMSFSMTLPGGKQEIWPMRGTITLRKGADGWKQTHWHGSLATAMAPAAPAAAAAPPAPTGAAMPAAMAAILANKKDLVWKDVPDLAGAKTAVAWEDPATNGGAGFLKAAKKLEFPWHYHSCTEHVTVVQGKLTVSYPDGTKHEVGPGGYLYLPGRKVHATKVDAGTTLLQITDAPEDFVMTDEKGTPLPPAPKK